MSNNPPPELKSLFETALNEFEKRAGNNLVHHPIVDKLVNCESADSVIDVLQEQAQAFRSFRGGDGKLMTWLKRTVNVLHALSTSDLISGAISSVCLNSFWHTLAWYDTTFSSAFPASKCNIRWNRHTSWRKCPTLTQSSGFCDAYGSFRQSRILLARATTRSSSFSSLSNRYSSASTFTQKCHRPRQCPGSL